MWLINWNAAFMKHVLPAHKTHGNISAFTSDMLKCSQRALAEYGAGLEGCSHIIGKGL
jgi:hypothetical protein